MKPLPERYDHKVAEKKWQNYWENNKVYAWDESQPRSNTFVIDTPPPTVSGLLHMGHIFSYTQADFVARYQRMSGKTVFYPMGFDDNGLPTERLVEKVKKIRATDMSREDFIKTCQDVVKEAEEEFRRLFRSVALSVDWAQEYQTISEESRKISQMSFLDLYNKNQAYRKLQPMFWDPVDQTAIAQAEIEDKELPSSMNYIEFKVMSDECSVMSEGKNLSHITHHTSLTIATTRPEMIPACVAVFYHPDDKRYHHLKGKTAVTPLFGVKVPILADNMVQMDKGTGLVMCCTFGDETDIKWWQKHNLPARIILNKYGKIDLNLLDSNLSWNDKYKDSLQGQKVVNAREKILEILKTENLVVKQEAIIHAVKCAERSGAPLEILPTHQWFVKVLDKKEPLKEKAAQCNWYPDYMRIRINQWIDGLNWDWCISRQRYFGVPFPVWYSKRKDEEGKIIVADADQLPVNPLVDLPKGYTKDEVTPDMDVMDTWATSSVSPQLSSKGINRNMSSPESRSDSRAISGDSPRIASGNSGNDTPLVIDAERHSKLFPADLRPQAHEIIRTWAFYTIVKAHLHENTIPWKNLMISGWCLAADKTKMSKSKGNVVTPVDLIENRGSDVVRYWASTSRLGADTAFSEDVLNIGKKLVNKLWNATKFAAIQLEKIKGTPSTAAADIKNGTITETLDKWILTRLRRAVEKATLEFNRFEYCDARVAIEYFFWNDFCDNYLEIVKGRSYDEKGENPKGQQSAIFTIYHCLEGVLRLFAPFVPHITDELYSHVFDEKFSKINSITARGTWPDTTLYPIEEKAEKVGIDAVAILNVVRKIKAEKNISIKWPIDVLSISGSDKSGIESCFVDLANVTNAKSIKWTDNISGETSATDDNKYKISAILAKESDAA